MLICAWMCVVFLFVFELKSLNEPGAHCLIYTSQQVRAFTCLSLKPLTRREQARAIMSGFYTDVTGLNSGCHVCATINYY